MHSVKVKRIDLLAKIKVNRDGHRDLFLKAQEGYRLDFIAELEQHLKDARDRKKITRSLSLPEPQDHTEDYDSVIAMLEMSVEDTIELDAGSFQQYVLDKWTWKRAVDVTNMAYASKVRAV
jgi:hypothetical protein